MTTTVALITVKEIEAGICKINKCSEYYVNFTILEVTGPVLWKIKNVIMDS